MESGRDSIDDEIQLLMQSLKVRPLATKFADHPRTDLEESLTLRMLGIDAAAWASEARTWLVRALRTALRIEMTVIPPYLVAMWSIKTPNHARAFLADVAREEMLHMGLICNTMASLGVDPPLLDESVVPKFPARLPAIIRQDIDVRLRSFSSDLLREVFIAIEEPSSASFRWDEGRRYWTIGAFYEVLEIVLRLVPASRFAVRNQIELAEIALTPVTSPAKAGDAMRLIRVQGEGTPGPLFGTDPLDDVAHYFRFCEILQGRRLVVAADGTWDFSGDVVTSPSPADVYRIVGPADPALAEAEAFDATYTGMLSAFADAWRTGMAEPLERAQDLMLELPDRAVELFEATLNPSTGECHGPLFRLL